MKAVGTYAVQLASRHCEAEVNVVITVGTTDQTQGDKK